MSAVVVDSVTKAFSKKHHEEVVAIDHVSFTVEPGELLVLVGPSGCGKTTLLRSVAGLERPTSGRISLAGTTVYDAAQKVYLPPNQRDIGMVFQSYALWPHMTVKKNVAYPLRSRRRLEELRSDRVAEVLSLVQCGELANRLPVELSGGQQQRVALARAIVSRPALMLLDEPLSNLDALLRTELRRQLRHLHRELRFSGIYVTHDQAEALDLGTRIAVMRAGRIEQMSAPRELYEAPATPYVARFMGIRNHLKLTRSNERWTSPHGPVDPGPWLSDVLSQEIEIYFRARHVHLQDEAAARQDDRWIRLGKGVLTDTAFGGEHQEHTVLLGTQDVAVLSDPGERYEVGGTYELAIRPQDALVYVGGQLVVSGSAGPRSEQADPVPGGEWSRELKPARTP